MQVRLALILSFLFVASVAVAEDAAAPSAACDSFAWDVSNELATLRSPALAIDAGKGGDADAVRIEPGVRHDVRLHPLDEVRLIVEPRKPPTGEAAGGVLVFQVPEDGRYRISLTTAHWIDVLDDGAVIDSVDHQGRRGCETPRKVVAFELPAGRDLVLQVLGGAGSETGLAITRAAAGAP